MLNRVVAQHDGKRWTNYRDLVAYASAVWTHVGPTLDAGGDPAWLQQGRMVPTLVASNASTMATRATALALVLKAPSRQVAKGSPRSTAKPIKRNGLPKAKRELTDGHRQKLLKEGKCLNCEETGHFARECPNPAKEVKQGF